MTCACNTGCNTLGQCQRCRKIHASVHSSGGRKAQSVPRQAQRNQTGTCYGILSLVIADLQEAGVKQS